MIKKEFKIPNKPGIRIIKVLTQDNKWKDFDGKKYKVRKTIKGKTFVKNFYTLKEAVHWKNTFVPTKEEIKKKEEKKFKEVYQLYKEFVYPELQKSTIDYKESKAKFFLPLLNYKISDITPEVIDSLIRNAKKKASKRRYNFDQEIGQLKAIFNWYIENYDYKYANPVLKRHKKLGKLKSIPKKAKKMSQEELYKFFEAMLKYTPLVFFDLAITQFFTAGRIQEVAGLTEEAIDLQNRTIEISKVIVWNKKKKFAYLKDTPKNGETRYCYINDTLETIIKRRLNKKPKNCKFLFHINGKPLDYRTIQYYYNKALKKAGLNEKYSGTHFIRHSMAHITRNITGSLDFTQAVTGHKDIKMVQHYAGSPSNKQMKAVIMVEEALKYNLTLILSNISSLNNIKTINTNNTA